MTRRIRQNRTTNWSTSQAKENLSEVIAAAQKQPQIILNREKKVAVLMSFEEYSKALQAMKQKSLFEIMSTAQKIAQEDNIELIIPERFNRTVEF